MRKQIFVRLTTEGTTDDRFLRSVVYRTFEDVALNECTADIDIYVSTLRVEKAGLSFPDYVVRASREGLSDYGIMVLAVHTDADRETYEERMQDKILPAKQMLDGQKEEECCKLLVPVIPVRMIEAWMLADKSLLKSEMGTRKSDHELGIDREPERIADPKTCIKEAVRKATEDLPNRRNRLSIADLYGILGDKLSLDSLKRLASYRKFVEEVKGAYKALSYIR